MEKLIDECVSVPLQVAARAAGVSAPRLRRWEKSELVQPTLHVGRTWGYTLDEVVVASIIRELENRGARIRQVKTVIEAARAAGLGRQLGQLHWGTAGNEAFVQFPDGSWFGNRRPNQSVLTQVLDLTEIRLHVRSGVGRPAETFGVTETRRGVRSSRLVFAGTRVPYETVERYVRHGFDDAHILSSFPALAESDIARVRAAVRSA